MKRMADTKLMVALKEEVKRWELLGWRINGVPMGVGLPGIGVEIFELDIRTSAVVKMLIDKEIFTKEEADIYYQQEMLDRLTKIREENEERVKAERIAAEIAVAQRRIIGPNGQPLN
jgi:hypothetical protein